MSPALKIEECSHPLTILRKQENCFITIEFASVPPEVKTIELGLASNDLATLSRACSNKSLASFPKACPDEGLPKFEHTSAVASTNLG